MDARLMRRVARVTAPLFGVSLLLLTAGIWQWTAPVSAAVDFPGVERYGVVQAGNESSFSFADGFDAPPTVVVSSQVGGISLLSSTIHTYDNGFNIFVTDHEGMAIPRAWVQWIAVESDPENGVQAGYALTGGGRISFDVPFERAPVVVTNAWANDKPMVSWTVDVDRTGFNVYALAAGGIPLDTNFNLYWLAVVPGEENGFNGGQGVYNHGDSVSFTPAMLRGPAYVVSAAGGLQAAAVDNRNDGFTLSLVDSTGRPTTGGEIQWLGYAGAPDTGGESGTNGEVGQARIIATSVWVGNPSIAVPDSACFEVSTDQLGFNSMASGCTSGNPATITLGSEHGGLQPGMSYYVHEQAVPEWELAGENPRVVEIPAETGVAIVFFLHFPSAGYAGVEQGSIVITAAFGGDAPLLPTGDVCFTVSYDEGGAEPLGEACGAGDPITVTLGPNNPDLETGITYWVREQAIPGWEVYGDNPVPAMILPFGAVGVAFVNMPAPDETTDGTLLIHKIDEDEAPLGGACWLVGSLANDVQYGADGNLCDDDGDGTIQLELPAGEYAVIETSPPPGYGVNHGQQVATVIAGETTEVTVVDTEYPPGDELTYLGGDFYAIVLLGPGSGREIRGHLSLSLSPAGEIVRGTLTVTDQLAFDVTGSIDGRNVALVITLADGRVLYVNGSATRPLANAAGTAGGTFSGPEIDDAGGWRLTGIQPETSRGPQPCPV